MLARFGLGRRTGVGLPGESAGRVPARETWSGSTFGNLPIGQGLSVTALQMAGMYQAVANDGLRVPPRIVEATIGPDGVRTPTPAPEPVRVVSPETAQKLRTMLTAVTQDGARGPARHRLRRRRCPATRWRARPAPPSRSTRRAAATPRRPTGSPSPGMLPAQDPRYVVAIMLDAPQGGTSAAPLFHDIASYLAQREQLPVSADPPPGADPAAALSPTRPAAPPDAIPPPAARRRAR